MSACFLPQRGWVQLGLCVLLATLLSTDSSLERPTAAVPNLPTRLLLGEKYCQVVLSSWSQQGILE